MPRQCRAIAAAQWLQAAGETVRKFTDTECVYLAGRKLDRQRKTVQLAAQIDDDRYIAVVQLELVQSCRGALDEQVHRRKTKRLGRSERCGRERHLQSRYTA